MADWHGGMNRSSSINGGNSRISSVVLKDAQDFEEEQGWFTSAWHSSSSSSSARTAPKMIPRDHESSSSKNKKMMKQQQQSSAPVNIPDWSKIYGKNPKFNPSSWDDHDHHHHHHHGDDGDDDEDDDEGMVPPHEWLAKKLARSQISSFSVCEGIGRTLKGRDLSKVRNAILTKTGFLE